MQITASLNEIVAAGRARALLPDAVTDLAGAPGRITAKVHVDRLPGLSTAKRLAAKAVGVVDATVTTELSESTFTIVIAATARVPASVVAEQVATMVRGKLTRLPDGLASVRTGDGRTMVDVNLDEVARCYQIRPTSITLGETIEVVATAAGDGDEVMDVIRRAATRFGAEVR